MKTLIGLARRYKFFLILFLINIALLFYAPAIGRSSFELTKSNLLEMLSVLPPIFILLGLLDVWVERETMMKYMGENAGVKGGLIAFVMGSAAAGPLYAAFPIAGILLKKGVTLMNIFIFIGAWSTTKIPMILFETSNLGWRYMLIRLVCNIAGITVIAFLLQKTAPIEEKKAVYQGASSL